MKTLEFYCQLLQQNISFAMLWGNIKNLAVVCTMHHKSVCRVLRQLWLTTCFAQVKLQNFKNKSWSIRIIFYFTYSIFLLIVTNSYLMFCASNIICLWFFSESTSSGDSCAYLKGRQALFWFLMPLRSCWQLGCVLVWRLSGDECIVVSWFEFSYLKMNRFE